MADNTLAWRMYRAALTDLLLNTTGSDITKFQGLQIPALQPPEVDWAGPNGQYNSFLFADLISAWSPVYQNSLGKRVTDGYHTFILDVAPPVVLDQDAAKQAQQLAPQVTAAWNALSSARQQIVPQWVAFDKAQQALPPEDQMSFDDWLAQDLGPQISMLETQYEGVRGQWTAAANKAAGGYQSLGNAVNDYNNPGFQVEVPFSAPGSTKVGKTLLRTWNFDPLPNDFLNAARAGHGAAFSLNVSNQTGTEDVTSWGVQGGADLDLGFISIGTEGGFHRTSVDATSQTFGVAFSAKSFTGIQITAGQWFHQNVVIQFKNGPFVPNAPTFFGSDGLLNLASTTAYVAYQPTIIVTLDSQAYSEVQSNWSVGATLGIGPFSFGGSGGGSSDKVKFHDDNQSIEAVSNLDSLQLIALVCTILPG